MKSLRGLYLILTNPLVGYEQAAEAAVNAHVPFLQLRMKNTPPKIYLKQALSLRNITRGSQTTFIINDHLQTAIEVDADGVHFGQQDGSIEDARQRWNAPHKWIGLSTHNLQQAQAAQAAGARLAGDGQPHRLRHIPLENFVFHGPASVKYFSRTLDCIFHDPG